MVKKSRAGAERSRMGDYWFPLFAMMAGASILSFAEFLKRNSQTNKVERLRTIAARLDAGRTYAKVMIVVGALWLSQSIYLGH